MEPRSAIGVYDPAADKWTLHVGCQGVFGLRGQIAKDILNVPPEKVRVLTGNVGGSFGMKAFVYSEYVGLFHAARALGRPGQMDRRALRELPVGPSRPRPRGHRRAGARQGRGISSPCASPASAMSARSSIRFATLMPTVNTVKNAIGVYKTPLIEASMKVVFTNTTLVSAYRGAGRPEGNYYMERLVDTAAAELGIDRIELRRRNHIQPAQMPYATPGRDDL